MCTGPLPLLLCGWSVLLAVARKPVRAWASAIWVSAQSAYILIAATANQQLLHATSSSIAHKQPELRRMAAVCCVYLQLSCKPVLALLCEPAVS